MTHPLFPLIKILTKTITTMKKFALFMMMATIITACGSKNQPDTDDEEQEIALTAEDSAAVIWALDDSIAAEIAAVPVPVYDEWEGNEDSCKAAFDAAIELYCCDTAAIYATREARLAADFAAALDAKKREMKDNDDEEDDDED